MVEQKKNEEPDSSLNKSGQQKPEGPHAREDLTDYEKTPGTGSLPGKLEDESDIGPD